MKELVNLKMGLELEMELIKTYPKGKLFFCQDRLCLTDLKNKEIKSYDLIEFILPVL